MPEPKVVLGVTGSIAAYKAVFLLRLLQKQGCDVHVVMTEAATKFVTPLTFKTLSRNAVAVDMFDENIDWDPSHIALANGASVFIIAPCTANVMAKIAHGIADDMLTCTALSVTCPLIIAPAMNRHMWQNTATQENLAILKRRGIDVINVVSGPLACGDEGEGRMADPDSIAKVAAEIIRKQGRKK